MHDTPSPRTSKHATAGKRNIKKAQHQRSLIQAPVSPPDRAAILPQLVEAALTMDDDEKRNLIVDDPQLDLVHFRDEDEVVESDEQASELVSEVPSADEGDAHVEWFGPRENEVDLSFNPFASAGNDHLDIKADAPSYEFREVPMQQSEPEPATAHVGDDKPAPTGAEYRPANASDSAAAAHPQRAPEVTSLNSPPTSPPPPPPHGSGRTRAPILISRNPTSPSSLSRQLQNVQALLPTSPRLGFSSPFGNFAAPRISNVTVSGSSFHNPTSRASSDPIVNAKETRRRSTGNYGESKERDLARLRMTPRTSKSSESDDEDDMPSPTVSKYTRYPTSSVGNDKVVFAAFTTLSHPSPSSPCRRLLFVGYENGLQIWDITHLGDVREVLSRRVPGAVIGCAVLPAPQITGRGASVQDAFAPLRPLLGIVVEQHDSSRLLIYSLATHEIVKKLDFSGSTVVAAQASGSFMAISTCSPFSLYILCSRTLNILHTIQARRLYIFSRPVSLRTPEGSVETVYSARQDRPNAVFTLSSRLLAFVSTAPSSEPPSFMNVYPRVAIPHTSSIQIGSLNVTQADIGNAAMKVGGGLLSGMKTLGGMAVAAARGEKSSSTFPDTAGLRKLFSRNSPSATVDTSRIHSSSLPNRPRDDTADADKRDHSQAQVDSVSRATPISITVLDLQPLLDDREKGRPEVLSDFTLPSGQVVSGLKFSEDGTTLSVSPSDGGTVRLYQIKPASRVLRSMSVNGSSQGVRDNVDSHLTRKSSAGSLDSHSSGSDASETSNPWHIYDLRRGRTSGIIETLDYSTDGRWVGIGTRKRTIHVFATNPYGGKPDEASHIEGKVKNVDEIQPLSTEVRPIVRLRSSTVSSPEQLAVPLAFTFIPSSPDSLPTKFLPSHSTFSPPSSVSSSIPSSTPHRRSQSVSPRLPPRPANYQDILTFDPSDGSLSLRRLTISTRISEPAGSFLASLPIPTGTSISLPGMGFTRRPNASPPKAIPLSSTPTNVERLPTELVAKESIIATWNLMRDSKWNEVKEPVTPGHGYIEQRIALPKSEWLAQAELSTCSCSTRIVPGSVYLSHQFSFYGLGEDYHALIRRLHFDILADKIEVRRQVEASAYIAGQGESFVSAAATPQDVRGARSFDDSLASAIDSGLEYSGSPPIIPMLPNGARPGSFKATIPIRSVAANLTEGVNEGIVRLSRGFRRVRSPRMHPTRTDESVPLEFDEEDEAFLSEQGNDNDNDTMSNSACGRDSHSVSTPSTNNNMPLVDNLDPEIGWLDDMDAVEEVERFDEINAARLMEEENLQQAPIRVTQKGHVLRKGGRGF